MILFFHSCCLFLPSATNLEFLGKLKIDLINSTLEICEKYYLISHLLVNCKCTMSMLQNGANVSYCERMLVNETGQA